MDEEVIGLLHPGEMGAAAGRELVDAGYVVLWASGGRNGATVRRADWAGLTDVQSVGQVLAGATVVLSICPSAAAVDVARSVVGFTGT
ncbi:MAG: hypothetical protein M3140_02070 [Actinomycetota bacterium]|nr:hypothetical protein [Actinomycetota bacterium]